MKSIQTDFTITKDKINHVHKNLSLLIQSFENMKQERDKKKQLFNLENLLTIVLLGGPIEKVRKLFAEILQYAQTVVELIFKKFWDINDQIIGELVKVKSVNITSNYNDKQ